MKIRSHHERSIAEIHDEIDLLTTPLGPQLVEAAVACSSTGQPPGMGRWRMPRGRWDLAGGRDPFPASLDGDSPRFAAARRRSVAGELGGFFTAA